MRGPHPSFPKNQMFNSQPPPSMPLGNEVKRGTGVVPRQCAGVRLPVARKLWRCGQAVLPL